jgi:hypothetical protein
MSSSGVAGPIGCELLNAVVRKQMHVVSDRDADRPLVSRCPLLPSPARGCLASSAAFAASSVESTSSLLQPLGA